MRIASLVCALCLTACQSPEALLSVQLQTDFVAGVEFRRVRTSLERSRGARQERTVSREDAFSDPRSVALFEGVGRGRADLVVELLGDEGTTVARRRAQVQVVGATQVTLLIARSCRGLSCPMGAPEATECRAGRCVVPACTEETVDLCGEVECASAEACAAPAPCAEAVCTRGACLSVDRGVCGAGRYCDPDDDCLPIEPVSDAGTPDAGTSDAGAPDAGPLDAGEPDAGGPGSGTCADPLILAPGASFDVDGCAVPDVVSCGGTGAPDVVIDMTIPPGGCLLRIDLMEPNVELSMGTSICGGGGSCLGGIENFSFGAAGFVSVAIARPDGCGPVTGALICPAP